MNKKQELKQERNRLETELKAIQDELEIIKKAEYDSIPLSERLYHELVCCRFLELRVTSGDYFYGNWEQLFNEVKELESQVKG
jgi:hypothetical protein